MFQLAEHLDLIIAVAIPVLGIVVAYGRLTQRVAQQGDILKEKASNERVNELKHTVEMNQRTLERLEKKLDNFLERQR